MAVPALEPGDLWSYAEAHNRDPAAVDPLTRALAGNPEALARMSDELQRATGGRRRPMLAAEVARYHLVLCIRCEAPRPGRGRYCGEGCRRDRNRPDIPGDEAEEDRRLRALRDRTRMDVRRALLSWLTRAPGAWVGGPDAEALGLLADLRADLDTLSRAGRDLGADGVGQREARAELLKALEERDGKPPRRGRRQLPDRSKRPPMPDEPGSLLLALRPPPPGTG